MENNLLVFAETHQALIVTATLCVFTVNFIATFFVDGSQRIFSRVISIFMVTASVAYLYFDAKVAWFLLQSFAIILLVIMYLVNAIYRYQQKRKSKCYLKK